VLYLWDRRTLFIGDLAGKFEFSQAAGGLMISLDGAMRVETAETPGAVECHSLLLAPGQSACVDATDRTIAVCYLDPFGEDYAGVASTMRREQPGLYIGLQDEQDYQILFRHLAANGPSPAIAYEKLDELLGRHSYEGKAVDPRVAQVVSLIKDSVTENRPVEAFAQHVNLSVPRLAELFREQLGIPIRRYRQWHRLYVTAVGVARGSSLTDAAIGAGFTDSSHFSHTFRTMLGLKPSLIFSSSGAVRIFIGQ
jgi:AraC-like DNA-binding protein